MQCFLLEQFLSSFYLVARCSVSIQLLFGFCSVYTNCKGSGRKGERLKLQEKVTRSPHLGHLRKYKRFGNTKKKALLCTSRALEEFLFYVFVKGSKHS